MQLQPSDPDIQTIVGRIRNGDLDLQPEFQRGEVWPLIKKKRLIDSILRNWHIPPIHVVVDEEGRQVVLDGQQRLVSIRDFVDGKFEIDGSIEPSDASIKLLDGLSYETLPPEVRRSFDQFTIRVFRITDYSPEEPGELFFRLNQMTYLTAAEQRNAFFGPVRQQVKQLVDLLQLDDADQLIGFSNRRMAYDDVIAKVLCTLEVGTLSKRLTAIDISNRFRLSQEFPLKYFNAAERSIQLLKVLLRSSHSNARFNKATLFTWLIFLSSFSSAPHQVETSLTKYLRHFNSQREHVQTGFLEGLIVNGDMIRTLDETFYRDADLALMSIYINRSSSRVSDVASVILRDFVVWALLARFAGNEFPTSFLHPEKYSVLTKSLQTMSERPSEF